MADNNQIISPKDALDNVMEELSLSSKTINQLTDRVIELEDLEKQSELHRLTLKETIQKSFEKITDLQKVEAEQKKEIVKLREEKESWDKERKLLEETCFRSTKKTCGIIGKTKDSEIELEEMKPNYIVQFQNTMEFWKEYCVKQDVPEEGYAAPCSPSTLSIPPSPSSLHKKEMNVAQKTMERQSQNIYNLKEKIQDLQNTTRDYEARMSEDQKTIKRQGLEISSLKQCLPDLQKGVNDHEAEMTQANQTIATQGLEISNLNEKLQDVRMVVKLQTEVIEKLSGEKLLVRKEADLLKSTNIDLEKCLSESRSLLKNATTELAQNTTLREEYRTLKEEKRILDIIICAERMKSEQLEDEQLLLEDICLWLKKRTLGIFGRRMQDRDTEVEKLRKKMFVRDIQNGYTRRARHNT